MPSAIALLDLRFVELEADLAQRVAHAQRALLAVRQEVRQARRHHRARVVDAVAKDVQFASGSGPARLPRPASTAEISTAGTTRTPAALARRDRLGDAADRVVVGQCQQLHASVRRALHDLGCRQRAVGVGRVRLQVKARRHGRQRMRSPQELRVLVRRRVAARMPVSAATRRPTTGRRRRTAAW